MEKIVRFFSDLFFKEEETEVSDEEPDSSKIKKYCNEIDIPFEYQVLEGPFVPIKCANKSLKEKCCNLSIIVDRKLLILSKDKSFIFRDNPRLLFNIEPYCHKISLKVWECRDGYYDFDVVTIDDYIVTNESDVQKLRKLLFDHPLTEQEFKLCRKFNKQSA